MYVLWLVSGSLYPAPHTRLGFAPPKSNVTSCNAYIPWSGLEFFEKGQLSFASSQILVVRRPASLILEMESNKMTRDYPKFADLPLSPSDPPHSAWGLWGMDDELGTLVRKPFQPNQLVAKLYDGIGRMVHARLARRHPTDLNFMRRYSLTYGTIFRITSLLREQWLPPKR